MTIGLFFVTATLVLRAILYWFRIACFFFTTLFYVFLNSFFDLMLLVIDVVVLRVFCDSVLLLCMCLILNKKGVVLSPARRGDPAPQFPKRPCTKCEKTQKLKLGQLNFWQNLKQIFGRNNFTPQQLMRCTRGSILRLRNVLYIKFIANQIYCKPKAAPLTGGNLTCIGNTNISCMCSFGCNSFARSQPYHQG